MRTSLMHPAIRGPAHFLPPTRRLERSAACGRLEIMWLWLTDANVMLTADVQYTKCTRYQDRRPKAAVSLSC